MKIKSKLEFTTRRPVAIIMIVLGIAVFGLVSYSQLSWELMPEISYPSFTIRTEYPGAAPEEVENVVSRPLEEQLSLIKNLVSVTSVSRPEQSDIILEFTWDAGLNRAAQEIREKLDQVFLDPAVKKPMILRYDPSLDPLLRIGVVCEPDENGDKIPLVDLRRIVEDEIARELEALPGVAAAKVKGGYEREILIKLDEKQLATYKIRFSDVTNRLAQENVNLAGGNIKEGETEYIVRTLNEFRGIKEIGDIIIAKKDDVLVPLKSLATISDSHKERQVITRVNDEESIEINIYKEADANLVDVSNRVKRKLNGTPAQQAFVKRLAEHKPEDQKNKKGKKDKINPIQEKRMTDYLAYRLAKSTGKNIQYHLLADQAIFIENSIKEVRNTAIYGGILAIIVLYLFLRNFSTTLIVAVSIPLSLIAAFAPLYTFNVTLNIMSLGGLALGIGMLVDNSIVVMESIFRCREEGDGWVESAVRGVSEVGGAVMASTLTTIAVFFPIVFVEGIAGQIFGDLSLAVVFSLLASLMVSLFFIPMLASRKFEISKDFKLRQFAFKIEDKQKDNKQAFINLLWVPIEIVINLAFLFVHFAVYGLLQFLSFFLVFFHLLLSILSAITRSKFQLHKKAAAGLKRFADNYSLQKRLWDNFVNTDPLNYFYEAIASREKWCRQPFSKFFDPMFGGKSIFALQRFGSKLLLFPLIMIRFGWRWFKICIVYFFLQFRFYFHAFFASFARFCFSLLGALAILLKGLVVLVVAVFSPFIKLISYLFNKVYGAVIKYYPRLLEASLKNSVTIILVVLAAFIFTMLVILPNIGTELIPEVHQGTLYVNVTFPVGTPVEKNDQLMQNISQKIKRIEMVDNISYYAGTTKEELSEKEVGEHIGKITVGLKPADNIQKAEERLIANIRDIISNFTDLDYNISRPVLFTMKPPIEIYIKGYSLDKLREVSSDLYEKIEKLPGMKDVQSSVKPGFPELVVEFDRMSLSKYNMNAFDVATLIKNKIEGFVATKFKEKDKRVDIRVYLKDDQRKRAENIRNLIINPGAAIPMPLSSVADVSIQSGPNEIRRVDQDRSAIITANINNISLDNAVASIYDTIENYSMPPGFSYEISGQNKEMETSMKSMTLAMVLAVFLVYIVMASQFESFMHPFLILFTIPMALIGVFLTLYVLNIPLGITVYIGIITLVGIVVNNAIILIDYINTLRKRGVEKLEAIKQAGTVRLRPILITTATTVLGLLPMALGLGEGAEIRTPMAISIIAGLLSATFLTLVLIPIVYSKFSK